MLRARRTECFVIAPAHLVADGTSVTVIAENRREGSAQVESADERDDVAVLRVAATAGLPCGGAWDGAAQRRQRLTSAVDAALEIRNEGGSLHRHFMRVTFHDTRHMTVRRVSTRDALFRGLSGSLQRIGGTPAGMLLAVDAETGEGVELRMDHLASLVRHFLDVPVAAAAEVSESGGGARGDGAGDGGGGRKAACSTDSRAISRRRYHRVRATPSSRSLGTGGARVACGRNAGRRLRRWTHQRRRLGSGPRCLRRGGRTGRTALPVPPYARVPEPRRHWRTPIPAAHSLRRTDRPTRTGVPPREHPGHWPPHASAPDDCSPAHPPPTPRERDQRRTRREARPLLKHSIQPRARPFRLLKSRCPGPVNRR